MSDNRFHLEVSNAIAGCQLVEQELKKYITIAFEAAQRHKKSINFSVERIESRPLGRLIRAFEKSGGDSLLIAELDKFKEERDFLAHQAVAQCFDLDMNFFVPETTKDRLAEIQINAEVLRSRIYEAGVILEFDNISDAG